MTDDKNKYILSINGMSKSFGRNKVLKHISMNVKPGTIMGLMGENGAGKSTLMRVLAGVISSDAGEILIDGQPVQIGKPQDAKAAGVAMVYQELNLVAQDTTRYGEDIYGEGRLPELIDAVCEIEGVHWVRILYCYPDRVTDKLIDTIARQPKAVHYFDIPVQHASAHVLRDMNRRGDRETITALCQKIREKIPDVVLRTTLIAGFPTESEEDFAELCKLVEEVRFDRLGCFAYSQEEDTPAAELEQIPEEVRRRRAEIIMELQMSAAFDFADRCTGRTLEVLAEGWEDGQYYGRSYMDAPDIDTRVYFTSEDEIEPGSYVPVLITDTDGYDLIGMAKAKEDTK